MQKRTRLIILLLFAVIFFIVTPYIVLYSLGYRIDIKQKRIFATGGIYVRVQPTDAEIIIDSDIRNKTNFFSNSVFVQDLLPSRHEVFITKDGYFDYKKNLLVKENEVTKLENVVLFKENPVFEEMNKNISYFTLAPNNTTLVTVATQQTGLKFTSTNLTTGQVQSTVLSSKVKQNFSAWQTVWASDSSKALVNTQNDYWFFTPFTTTSAFTHVPSLAGAKNISFNPQDLDEVFFTKNGNLYTTAQSLPILKDVLAYQIKNQSIIWLGNDGFLYTADIQGKNRQQLSQNSLVIKKDSSFELIILSDIIFVKGDAEVWIFDQSQKQLNNFSNSVKKISISPNKNQILYFNDGEIFYYLLDISNQEFLKSFPQKIDQADWINDDYIYFQSGDQLNISEIDIRGNINVVTLPQTVKTADGKTVDLKDIKVTFNPSDKKFYILTQGELLSSERIIP